MKRTRQSRSFGHFLQPHLFPLTPLMCVCVCLSGLVRGFCFSLPFLNEQKSNLTHPGVCVCECTSLFYSFVLSVKVRALEEKHGQQWRTLRSHHWKILKSMRSADWVVEVVHVCACGQDLKIRVFLSWANIIWQRVSQKKKSKFADVVCGNPRFVQKGISFFSKHCSFSFEPMWLCPICFESHCTVHNPSLRN